MPKILGVNIDSGSLNVSLIDSKFRSVKHIKTERVLLPGTKEEKDIVMAAALTKWQKEYTPKGAVIGLTLQNFSWRTVEMLSMKRADMHKALLFELEKYLPLPVDEYMYDFLVTGTGLTGPNMVKLLVFSIKKEVLNALLNIVKETGLEILSVRCSTIDILAGVMDISGKKKLDGVFVNSADDAYEIAGLHDSMPVYMKRVPKAAEVKDEIEGLIVGYPGGLYAAGPIEQSVIGNFDSRKFQLLVPDLLASSFVKKTQLNLNFLPHEFVKPKKDYYPYIIGGLAAATVLIFFLTGVITYYKERRASERIEARISSIKRKASGIIEAQKKMDLLQNDRKILFDFQNRSNRPVRILSTLSRILPVNAWLINFSIDDKGRVEIEGFSPMTADLILALEKSKAFKNITFSAPIISKDKVERFALKMEVEGF
jgi:Tfp pilus assembly protein PilN